jgi:hypothetical protein
LVAASVAVISAIRALAAQKSRALGLKAARAKVLGQALRAAPGARVAGPAPGMGESVAAHQLPRLEGRPKRRPAQALGGGWSRPNSAPPPGGPSQRGMTACHSPLRGLAKQAEASNEVIGTSGNGPPPDLRSCSVIHKQPKAAPLQPHKVYFYFLS